MRRANRFVFVEEVVASLISSRGICFVSFLLSRLCARNNSRSSSPQSCSSSNFPFNPLNVSASAAVPS